MTVYVWYFVYCDPGLWFKILAQRQESMQKKKNRIEHLVFFLKKKKKAWHFAFLSKGPETNFFFFFWPYCVEAVFTVLPVCKKTGSIVYRVEI